MSQMQENNQAADTSDNGLAATRCRDHSMHSVQLHDSCTDRDTKCRSMSLNARCAKSVLRWINQSMRNDNQSAAGQTSVGCTQPLGFHSRVKVGAVNERLSTDVFHKGAKLVGHAQAHA